MNDNRKENYLSNISEDTAKLLRDECAELGRKYLYKDLVETPGWAPWKYVNREPENAEEYALDPDKGVIRKVPEWASRRAIFDFFREELEKDFKEYTESVSANE